MAKGLSSVVRCSVALAAIHASAAGSATLVLHVPLDDGSGASTAVDVSGSGLDGTLVDVDTATAWVAGQDGDALDFDGIDDHITWPDDPLLDFGTGDFTVSYWFLKQSTTSNFDNIYGVSKWSTGASPGINEWALTVGTNTNDDDPVFSIQVGTDTYRAGTATVPALNQWHHIVGVRKGTELSLYLDGVLAGQDASLPPAAMVNEAGKALRMAVNQPVAPLFYTDAIFDDLQIYHGALTDGDVALGEVAGGEIAFLFQNPGLAAGCGDGVLSSDEACDDGNLVELDGCSNLCELEFGCLAAPDEECVTADRAKLLVKEGRAGKETFSLALKKLAAATVQSDLGDPVGGFTRLDVCIYDPANVLVGALTVDRAGDSCAGKACWKAVKTVGFKYKDKELAASGVRSLSWKSGASGKGKLQVTAKNNAKKGQNALPLGIAAGLDGAASARAQVIVDDGACFEAAITNVKKADAGTFSGRRP